MVGADGFARVLAVQRWARVSDVDSAGILADDTERSVARRRFETLDAGGEWKIRAKGKHSIAVWQ